MMALSNTVRHGSRLSLWNTKPRSPPGARTVRPSSSTAPALAGSSPATMRKSVVLPQPLGPTSEMNAPRSIAILISCKTSRSPKRLVNPVRASFAMTFKSIPRPWHHHALDPGETGCHDDPGNRQNDHTSEQLRHIKRVGRLADEAAETRARPEQFSNDHADKAAADTELEAGKDERHRGRQRQLEEDLPRRRPEAAQHLYQPRTGGAQARLRVDGDWEQHQEYDDQHLRPDSDAEPENEQRRQRNGGGRIESRNPWLQDFLAHLAARHREADPDPEQACDHISDGELGSTDRDMRPQLAGDCEVIDRRENLSWGGQEQRIGDHHAAQELPQGKPGQNRHQPGDVAAARKHGRLDLQARDRAGFTGRGGFDRRHRTQIVNSIR